MSLIAELMTPCTLLTQKPAPGGGKTWEDGAAIVAAILKVSAIEAQIAESQGLRAQYTVVVPAGTTLEHDMVFRRDADGMTFRVTGDTIDAAAPARSSAQIAKTTAERWEVPAT